MTGRTSRAPLLGAAILALLAAACGPPERPGTPPERVLLITLEGLRADHCSALGYARATTRSEPAATEPPFDLAAVADAGVLFANAFAPAPQAEPALAGLLQVEASSALPEVLRDAGWRTAAFLEPSPAFEPAPLQRGFERFHVGADAEDALAAALEWFAEELPAGERAFVWLHLAGPASPKGAAPLEDGITGTLGDTVDRYDGAIARANRAVAELLAAYRALPGGPLRRTLIVTAGTHGRALPGDAERGEALAAEGRLRVPLALCHPASLTGRRILAEPITLDDLAPTLCDWLRCAAPEGMRGRSLLPLVDSYVERPFERRPAFAAWDDRASLRSADRRVVARVPPASGGELAAEALSAHPPVGPPRELAPGEHPGEVETLLDGLADRLWPVDASPR